MYIAVLKISAESGSPWNTPLLNGIAGVDQLLVTTAAERPEYM